MTNFKIGDRVRYTGKDSRYNEKKYIGCTGTVQSLIDNGVVVLWDKTNKEKPGLGAKYPENLELISTSFEVGKKYKNKFEGIKTIICVFADDKGGLLEFNNGTRVWRSNAYYKSYIEQKPEDWRCLHYKNNIAYLGGESFQSKEEVEKKFSSSTDFIKAIRVDA